MQDANFLINRPIAHRGLFNKNNKIPENSMIAFEKAIEKGYSIELDVHLLKSGELVVFHDDNLNRMTGVNRKIKDCKYDEIKNLKLQDTNYTIPLFKDVLKLVNGIVPILIEIKSDRKVGETEKALIDSLDGYKGEFAMQSFSPFSVKWFEKNFPEILRGQLASSFKNDKMFILKKFFLKNLYFNFLTKPNFISYCVNDVPNKRIESLRKSGKIILLWTIKTEKDLEKTKFCDNIIFENEPLIELYQGKQDVKKS